MTTTAICSTILAQLGGSKFLAMTGARDLLDLGNGLRCRIGKNAKKVTHFEAVLDDSDTYTVRFFQVKRRGLDVVELGSFSLVYADQLRQLFETETGLRTSL